MRIWLLGCQGADEEAAVPLSSYAERLRSGRGLVRLTSTEALIEMFVVPFDTLLAMTEIKPHEDLLAEGALVPGPLWGLGLRV